MTLLEIVEKLPEAEALIHEYDAILGICLLCNHLFDSIEDIEQKYLYDLAPLTLELNNLLTNCR